MSSQLSENNSELKKSLKERIELLMTDEEKKKPYAFATRIGLSKGTFTGIWVDGRTTLHQKTVDKIAQATGANPVWLATGAGEPWQTSTTTDTPVKVHKINKKLLLDAITTAEQAVKITKTVMEADKKSELISTLLNCADQQHDELLKACIVTIEKALNKTRRIMSPKDKTELILVIYNFYSDKTWTQDNLKFALDQLIGSVK